MPRWWVKFLPGEPDVLAAEKRLPLGVCGNSGSRTGSSPLNQRGCNMLCYEQYFRSFALSRLFFFFLISLILCLSSHFSSKLFCGKYLNPVHSRKSSCRISPGVWGEVSCELFFSVKLFAYCMPPDECLVGVGFLFVFFGRVLLAAVRCSRVLA